MEPEALNRKPWSWPALAAAIIVLFFLFIAPSLNNRGSKASGVDLVGVVTATNGVPIANASIFIYTAGPRSGPGFL